MALPFNLPSLFRPAAASVVPVQVFTVPELDALRARFYGQRLASRQSRINALFSVRKDQISRDDVYAKSFDLFSPSETLAFADRLVRVDGGRPADPQIKAQLKTTPPEAAGMLRLMFDNFGVPFHAGEFTKGTATRRYIPTAMMRFIVEYAVVRHSLSNIYERDTDQSVEGFVNQYRYFAFSYAGFSIAPPPPNKGESMGAYLKRGGFLIDTRLAGGKEPLAVYIGYRITEIAGKGGTTQIPERVVQYKRRTSVCYQWGTYTGNNATNYPVCMKAITLSASGEDQGIITYVTFNADGTITQSLSLRTIDKGKVGDWLATAKDEFVGAMCDGKQADQEVDALGRQIVDEKKAQADAEAQLRQTAEGAAGDEAAKLAVKYGGKYGVVGAGLYYGTKQAFKAFGVCDPGQSVKIAQTGLVAPVDPITGTVDYPTIERQQRMAAIRASISYRPAGGWAFAPFNQANYPTPHTLTKAQLLAAAGVGFLLMAIVSKRRSRKS
jgi:hypothetical protein